MIQWSLSCCYQDRNILEWLGQPATYSRSLEFSLDLPGKKKIETWGFILNFQLTIWLDTNSKKSFNWLKKISAPSTRCCTTLVLFSNLQQCIKWSKYWYHNLWLKHCQDHIWWMKLMGQHFGDQSNCHHIITLVLLEARIKTMDAQCETVGVLTVRNQRILISSKKNSEH